MNIINSISDHHRLLSIPKPEHPSVSVVNIADVRFTSSATWEKFVLNFYCIALKKNFTGKMKYGQEYYDFDEGVMTFTAPGQVLSLDFENIATGSGYMLFFHPEFIQGYPLARQIRNYGFFSYAVNEALHLSGKEETIVNNILLAIQQEYSVIDLHSQNVIVSQIDLLLNYSNRFYERQFITRKGHNNSLLIRFEESLAEYFDKKHSEDLKFLTVQHIAQQLHVSPNYLSDMLRVFTGRSTQQHIQDRLIEKAKEILSTTDLSVGEIAWQLGFEHPQSFNKLFKNKTNLSPLQYRQSFN